MSLTQVQPGMLGTPQPYNFKNRIINGAMVIDQRNAGAQITPTDGQYSVDRFCCSLSTAGKYTVQQNAGGVTPPAGFTNYLGFTSTSAYSIAAGNYFLTFQVIEGFNAADLGWGSANAQTVTLSFWARSSLAGTWGGSITNGSENYCYPFTYTINSANTWEYKTITIAGATAGTWATNNTSGIKVFFTLALGSNFTSTPGVWGSSAKYGCTGTTSLVGVSGATFYLTGVQFEVGVTATTFDTRAYGQELALAQRYYWKVTSNGSNITGFGSGNFTGSTNGNVIFTYPVTMRASPTMSYSGSFNVNGGSNGFAVSAIGSTLCSPTYGRIDVTVSGATTGQGLAGWIGTASTDYVQATAEL